MESYIWKPLIGALSVVPIFLVTGVMARRGLPPEITCAVWFFGGVAGIFAYLYFANRGSEVETLLSVNALFVLALGLTFGTLANVMFFQAINEAPNPGIAVSIMNTNALLAFLAMPIAIYLMPSLFEATEQAFTLTHFGGVVFILAGLALLTR